MIDGSIKYKTDLVKDYTNAREATGSCGNKSKEASLTLLILNN